MINFNQAEKQTLLKFISRTPSAHNIQPIRLNFNSDHLLLIADHKRILFVSDPTRRDHLITLGMGLKALEMGLQAIGYKISNVDFEYKNLDMPSIKIVIESSSNYSINNSLLRHACYRDQFVKDAQLSKLELSQYKNLKAININQTEDNKWITNAYEKCLSDSLADVAYAGELYQWMRLTPAHKNFQRDGLNYQMMALPYLIAQAARVLMHPIALKVLSVLKMIGLVATERPQNSTAEGFILYYTNDLHPETLINAGSELMESWLEVEKQGRSFCPITTLIDDKKYEQELRKKFNIQDKNAIHILRYGAAKSYFHNKTWPRLELSEFELK